MKARKPSVLAGPVPLNLRLSTCKSARHSMQSHLSEAEVMHCMRYLQGTLQKRVPKTKYPKNHGQARGIGESRIDVMLF